MRSNTPWLLRVKHSLIALTFLCPTAVSAQLVTNYQSFNGTKLSIDGALGVRCNSDSGALPSIFGSTGQTGYSPSFNGSSSSSDVRAIVGFVIPIKPGGYGDCNRILSYEEAAAKLQLAMMLMESGTITPEQYNEIAQKVHELISTEK